MDESSSQDPKRDEAEQSVDLSELKSFSFGTQWSESPKSARPAGKGRPSRSGPPRGDRPDRRPGGSPTARKDRRPARAEGANRPERRFRPEGSPPGDREEGRRPQRGGRHAAPPPRPYESEVFEVCFYPEDNCFSAIIKAMRANHLTYELFHVAKLFLEKPDRYIASITRRPENGQKPDKVYMCAADNVPFPTEDEVVAHAMAHHAEAYFDVEEVEVEPPSGNFPFVNRCPFTKELLGPPNYHKYEQILRNHHRTRLPNMPFEKLQNSIESVRDEEAVNQWLESQKKATRYKTKAAEGEESKTFDSIEDASGYLRTAAKAKVVKQVNYARVHGTELEKYPETEASKAVEGERQRQLRFPLDTANAIRGRMRREKFSIYKKGAKGVTYVCATKRNFRAPGQVMAPDLDRIIRFLESHAMIKAKEFTPAYGEWLNSEAPEESFDEKKALRDLHWLVADGYVTHFEDDALLAQPVLEAGNGKSDKDGDAAPRAKAPKPPAAAPEQKETSEQAGEAPEASAAAEEQPAADSSAVDASAAAERETAAETEPTAPSETPVEPAEAKEQLEDAAKRETAQGDEDADTAPVGVGSEENRSAPAAEGNADETKPGS